MGTIEDKTSESLLVRLGFTLEQAKEQLKEHGSILCVLFWSEKIPNIVNRRINYVHSSYTMGQ